MKKFWNSDETRRRMLSRFVLAAPLLVVALGANTAAAAGPVKGLEFTISGPAFSEPAHFVVPAAKVKLTYLLYSSNFTLMALLKPPVTSVDGKHQLNHFVLGAEPAGVGTFTETSGLSSLSFSFTTDVGATNQQGFSVSYKYSRGTTLPAQITFERYDVDKRATGTFSGKLQRTNPKRKDQIYEISGRFGVDD